MNSITDSMKNRQWYILILGLLAIAGMVKAQNPIIRDQFSADPTARVFEGKMYVYPSHDIPSPIERLKEWFCMADYHVFSSDDLVDWKDHGVIVSQERVPWVQADSYSMWAPDCVYKDGTYYFYFPATPKGEGKRGYMVGVATSDKPYGPFVPQRRAIEGVRGIDPCVLVDKDGQSYIYWAGGGMFMAKLKDNMLELASKPVRVEGLPDGFKEGPFVFERNGKYYFTFPWVQDKTETLAYAMGDSPMGPFEFKGLIMEQSPTGCWTNHHSIVEYKGQWYLFYHHNDYSPAFDKNRSVRIDSLSFNADGTIRLVKPTLRGVGITDARTRIQIDRYSSIGSEGISVAFLNEVNKFEGWKTLFAKKNAWLQYNNVDFGGEKVHKVTVRVKSARGGTLQIRNVGKAGSVIASVNIPKSKDWTEVSAPVVSAPTGVNDLHISLQKGSAVEVDWIGFDALPWDKGAFETKKYRNLFAEMGYKQSDIDAKLKEVFDGLFSGPDKVYFEVGDSMAYISDIKNHDVRTEGMSYGLMIAVQFDRKDIFDRLWRWGKKYMQHQDGPWKGYFAWSCKIDGTRNSQGPASDGELYYVTSLIFASNRWGNDKGINYLAEAQNILNCSMQKVGMNRVSPFINPEEKLITFTPDPWGGRFTDPSYHLPAFYEVWARWAEDGRSDFWLECARKSREYLHKSIHPVTGLNPDYSNYDGTLLGSNRIVGDAFRFDSWRVPMNIALDYSWSCADRKWQQEYGNKIQNFLYSQGIDTFVDQYNVDGTQVADTLGAGGYKELRHSLGLVATAAAASLTCTHDKGREFVDRLWNAKHVPYEDGYFDAYYDGLLRLFAMMHLSGNYRIIFPQVCTAQTKLPVPGQETAQWNDIDYAGDNMEAHKLDIYLPATPQAKHKVVVIIYGSAWYANNMKQMAFQAIGKPLLDRGFAVVSINHRSSGEAKFPAQINDVKAAIRFIRGNADKYRLDTSFIGITGFSSGGHLSALAGTTNGVKSYTVGDRTVDIEGNIGKYTSCSSRVDAVVDWFGPIDMTRMADCNTTKGADSPEAALIGGVPAENPELLALLNPMTYIDKGDPKFVVIHGDADSVVPNCQSIYFSEALKGAGLLDEFISVPGGEHGPVTFNETTFKKMTGFFARQAGLR